jgi:hypothetical protein
MQLDVLSRTLLFGAVVSLLLPGSARAGDVLNADQVCASEELRLDRHRYLRSLSLELSGELPTMERYAQLDALEDVPDAWVDDLLASEGFVKRFVKAQRALLWNNITFVRVLQNRSRLRRLAGVYLTNSNRSVMYRGENVSCRDEPLEVVDGVIETTPDGDALREGRRSDVVPYWDPSAPVKVCGFDAQEALFSPTGTDCSTPEGAFDPGCGCGPNMNWCGTRATRDAVKESFGEAMDKTLEHLIREGSPYTELFTTRVAYVNGPLVHYWKHWVSISGGVQNEPVPLDVSVLPDLPFTARDTWVQIELPESHAGLLTRPAYLLRFQTNRGRASQFYTQFLCKPFQPPSGALPVADEAALNQPDLQLRAGCKYCHAILEPTAAYWGRWPQAGAGFLEESGYPATDPECFQCATTGASCPDYCKRFYHTVSTSPADEAYLGMLQSYLFLRTEHKVNVQQGPRLLAMKAIATNELPACTVETTAARLLGRPLSDDEVALQQEWIRAFATSGFSYRALVKSIVTHSIYRRVR